MSYKCPLCLRDLTPQDELIRFCTKHAERHERFKCTAETIPREFLCPKRGCYSNSELAEGVFILHVGCDAKNPFWDADKKQTVIPGDKHSTRVTAPVNVGKQVNDKGVVQHWEIGMLRVVPNMYEEMWFPLMLLRATGERDAGGKPVGSLVELSGAKEVGKTIIALQAMDYQGYVPSGVMNVNLNVNGFIYSRTPAGFVYSHSSTEVTCNIPMLSILHLHTILTHDRAGTYAPLGTAPMPGDLKAAFILPSSAAPTNGNRAGGGGIVSRFVQEIGSLLGNLFWGGGGAHVDSPHWHSLLFYDSAGEDVEFETMRRELRAVDKLAVFVDAREVFSGPGKSIEAAVQRLSQNWTSGKKPCALVVTKLDLVFGNGGVSEAEIRGRTRADAKGDPVWFRDTLIDWLKRDVSGNRQQLLAMLEADSQRGAHDDKYVERVFFVWTENLSETERKDHLQPESHGLAHFVCWCLGREWAEINHSRGAAASKA